MDKIKIFSPSKHVISNQILTSRNFKEVRTERNSKWNGITTEIKTLSNLESRLIFSPKGTSIITNPSKWLKDDNSQQLTFNELEQFVPEYLRYMVLNNADWHLTGLDYNQDILTSYDPSIYLPIFHSLTYFNKTDYYKQTGIRYSTKSRDYVVYDKVKELKQKGCAIPQSMANKNILRLEYCINRNFSNSKMKAIKTLNDLIIPANYNTIVNEWYRYYTNIKKIIPTKNDNDLIKPSDMKIEDFAILNLINNIGLNRYKNMIEEDQKRGMYTRQAAHSKRKKANDIIERYTNSRKAENLFAELDKKVTDRYKLCLQ